MTTEQIMQLLALLERFTDRYASTLPKLQPLPAKGVRAHGLV